MTSIPRPECLKLQFYRETCINLNEERNFAFDFGVSGVEKGWHKCPSELDKKIVVPFCLENKLSGIENTDLSQQYGITGHSVSRRNVMECMYFCFFVQLITTSRQWLMGSWSDIIMKLIPPFLR